MNPLDSSRSGVSVVPSVVDTSRMRYTMADQRDQVLKKEGGAPRSVRDIMVQRQKKKVEPDFKSDILKKLAPDFVPERKPKRLNSANASQKLMTFDSDGTKKPPLPMKPIERPDSQQFKVKLPEKSNTIPFSKPEITVDEMRKTKVTSMGVLPFRDSSELTDLRILMQGQPVKPVTSSEETESSVERHEESHNIFEQERTTDHLAAIQEVNQPDDLSLYSGPSPSRGVSAVGPPGVPQSSLVNQSALGGQKKTSDVTAGLGPTKIALVGIFGALGTVSRVPAAKREERQIPASTLKEPVAKRLKQKRKHGDTFFLTDDAVSIASSDKTFKSADELMAEAKMIAKSKRKSTIAVSDKEKRQSIFSKASRQTVPHDGVSGKIGSATTTSEGSNVRSVEEIIASLRAVDADGGTSEADRRIEQLMNQVLESTGAGRSDGVDSRASPLPMTSPMPLRSAEQQIEAPKMTFIESTLADLTDEVLRPTDDTEMVQGTEDSDQSEGESHTDLDEEEKKGGDVPKDGEINEELQICLDKVSGGDEEVVDGDKKSDEIQMTTEEAMTILAETPTVTYSDIVAVKGKQATKNVPEVKRRTEEKKREERPVTTVAKDRLSIHTFCRSKTDLGEGTSDESSFPEGLEELLRETSGMSTEELKKLWKLNHTPGKYRTLLESNLARIRTIQTELKSRAPSAFSSEYSGSRARSAMTADSFTTETTRPVSAAASEVRITEATDRIMTDIEKLTEWQQEANKVLHSETDSTGDLSGLWGQKICLTSDLLSNLWEPAPPKMLATPQRVRRVLFPKYRSSFVGDFDDLISVGGSSDEEDDGDGTTSASRDGTDPEFQRIRERLLTRQYGSLENLSTFEIVQRDLPKVEETTLHPSMTTTPERPKEAEDILGVNYAKSQPGELAERIRARLSQTPVVGDSSSVVTGQTAGSGAYKISFFTKLREDRKKAKGFTQRTKKPVLLTGCAAPTVPSTGSAEGQRGEEETRAERGDRRRRKPEETEQEKAIAAELATASALSVVNSQSSTVLLSKLLPKTALGKESDVVLFCEVLREKDDTRYLSLPSLHLDIEDSLIVHGVYDHTMKELTRQKNLISKKNADLALGEEEVPDSDAEEEEEVPLEEAMEEDMKKGETEEGVIEVSAIEDKSEEEKVGKPPKKTPADIALEAGRNYVILPKQKKGQAQRKPRFVSMSRRDAIERFVKERPNIRSRRISFTSLKAPVELELRVPKHVRVGRRGSVPRRFDFDTWAKANGYKGREDQRDWVVVVWDRWFDEVYPPPSEEDKPAVEPEPPALPPDLTIRPHSVTSSRTSSQRAVGAGIVLEEVPLPRRIDSVLDDVEVEQREEIKKILKAEAARLTKEMQTAQRENAFFLCRRGAINRKLGYLTQSLNDLNKAIEIEPRLLDAYWHRHLLLLLGNKLYEALDDLNTLLKFDKKHQSAYKSRGEIYHRLGDETMAILNYTQALKLDPKDHEAFFKRAEMYEQRGEMRLALEDYSNSTRIKPDKIEARFKHSMYYFQSGQWQSSVAQFTELLKQDPLNSEARCLRGQALAKLNLWLPAVSDLSAALHLNPNNSKAFYYRGCLLRKAQPQKALQDLSISLLLDSSEANVNAFLHRAILYTDMGRPDDAIHDFEAVIELNQEIASAHINLGLIYFNMNFPQRAIRYFTSGLKADPTYLRGYICRAETYASMKDYKSALLDITRAIFIRPDNLHLYMFRGQYVLSMGKLELAAFCVRHAAEIDEALGNSPTQQALVQTFLHNYDKAISSLTHATRLQPTQDLLTLLGKTQMKGEKWGDAIATFSRCLEQLKPWNPFQSWPPAAAEIHFMMGMCHKEEYQYQQANESFKAAIAIKPKFAEAYYQRGLCRIRLKQGNKGLQDFNRALALDPKLYQIFLSRACYYGIRGRYSKAILNCNEALKLQPQCVRAYLYRGSLKYHIKAYKLAIEDLSRTTDIDSKCALAYFNRAICQHEANNVPKALMDYGIVLLLEDPKLHFKGLVNRGLLYLQLDDSQNALIDFQLASDEKPNDFRLLHTIGYCHHRLGNLNDSIVAYTRALDVNPTFFSAFIGRGNTFMDFMTDRGRTLAARDYQRVLINRPDHLIARINLAFCLQVSGKFWQSWNQFTAVISHHPTSHRALEGRAIVCLQMSDPGAALQDLHLAVGLKGTAEIYNNRGVVHQFIGDRVNAMRDYKKATLVDPKYGLAHYNQALMYLHTRQFSQALSAADHAVQFCPKDEGARLNRGIIRAVSGDSAGALDDLTEAIKLSPFTAHAYFNRGHVHASREQWKAAEKDFSKALSLVPDDPFVYKARADCRGKLGKKDQAIQDYKRAVFITSKMKGE